MSSKIKITTTKQASDPWVSLNKDIVANHFSQEEIANVILPFIQYTTSLPGYVPQESSSSINGNVQTTYMAFDSPDHLMEAKNKLFGSDLDQVVVAKNELLKSKQEELGVEYTTEVEFINDYSQIPQHIPRVIVNPEDL